MLKWKQVEGDVVSLLRDISDQEAKQSERERRYNPKDLIAWWNNAQRRLATQRSRRCHQIYKDDGTTVSLPQHFYRPLGVFLPGVGQSLPRLSIETWWFDTTQQGYYINENKLTVTVNAPHFLLAFDGYYPDVTNEDSWVHTPDWALEACSVYVAMQAVTQEMLRDARYRKFISKQDAGNPQQSPFIPVAEWLRDRFYEIINTHSDDDTDAYQ
jgi:hypothetical protein